MWSNKSKLNDGKPSRGVAMSAQASMLAKKKAEIEAKMATVAKIKETNSDKKEKKPISLSISKRWGLKGKKNPVVSTPSKSLTTPPARVEDPGLGIEPPSPFSGYQNNFVPAKEKDTALAPPPWNPSSQSAPPPPHQSWPAPPPQHLHPAGMRPPTKPSFLQPPPFNQPPPPPTPSCSGPPPSQRHSTSSSSCTTPFMLTQPPPPPPPRPLVSPPNGNPPKLPPFHIQPPSFLQRPPMPQGPLQPSKVPLPSCPPPTIKDEDKYDPFNHDEDEDVVDEPVRKRKSRFDIEEEDTFKKEQRSGSDNSGKSDNEFLDKKPKLEVEVEMLPAVVEELAQMVAVSGDDLENIARERNKDAPEMEFLQDLNSRLYVMYRDRVEQIKKGMEPQNTLENDVKQEIMEHEVKQEIQENEIKKEEVEALEPKKKRKSRWGGKDESIPPPTTLSLSTPGLVLPTALGVNVKHEAFPVIDQKPKITPARAANPSLLAYAQRIFGTLELDEDQWKQCEEQIKMAALYANIAAKQVQARIKQNVMGKAQYEYDSDEDTEGGTWEHKARLLEMAKTQADAEKQTSAMDEGKHHIGDFLPPEELSKFLNKYKVLQNSSAALEESAFQENKLNNDNVGFKMLQKMGWSEGQGLGSTSQGIVNPIGKSGQAGERLGLGANTGEADVDDDEFDTYRKRMMLAYRFRPNPLNNPRRQYY